MECNKEEAIRAQELSEKKLKEKDYAGAKRFALKAQALYPGLDGISQILTTVDVYICGENKINGEIDWYSVLGVDPLSDEDTIRKQYRKLALVLHPDKNKFVGADGAFKFISEAWSLLSDKSKRLAYNQRRNFKVQTMPRGNSTSSSAGNGFHNPHSRPAPTNSNSNTQRTTAAADRRPPPSQAKANNKSSTRQRTDTFWTLCRRCKMHYEYVKLYLNHTLLCPNCHQPFVASETAPPPNLSKLPNSSSNQQQHQNPNCDQFNHVNNQQTFNTRPTASSSGPHVSKKAVNTAQQTNNLKREQEAPVSKDESLLKKARGVNNETFRAFVRNNMTEGHMGNGVGGMRSISSFFTKNNAQSFPGVFNKSNKMRDLTPLENRNLLTKRAQKEILKMLDSVSKAGEGSGKEILNKKENEKKDKFSKRSGPPHPNVIDEVKAKLISITVPDPDFHDFDRDRNETSFCDSDVWAAYDDDDGMPRFYALIQKVISVKPFKLRLSWLNSKSTSEFSPMKWTTSGFTKTCGEFWVGKYENSKSLNSFSHKVNWEKGPKGSIFIFPKKGDIWALYRNWSPDWDEQTQDELINVYDMVKVVDDYSKDEGVSVVPLLKAPGFKTVFHPCTDPDKVKRIPKEEMFRFSHQVPGYLLTGVEGKGAPEGHYELDPAATSMELLRVLTETNTRDP
ncbi:uncharacterized protein LOC124945288 [Impatiens glandulifera]|uniref:uncharacterized protein LOC124945288 n=1 Tax=Impatiens glandulifera TaxID=253017 RepID=UPI001FB19014|nr:uncharacterized protein LOC124945288 [Impatiens glandulifera]